MSCCKNSRLESLTGSAVEFGFDSNWAADILAKYGPDVLSLVIEAARSGFTVQFIVEVVAKFGPPILELLIEMLNKNKLQGESGQVSASVIDVVLIEALIKKYFYQYGDQLIQLVAAWLMSYLQKFVTPTNPPEPTPAVIVEDGQVVSGVDKVMIAETGVIDGKLNAS